MPLSLHAAVIPNWLQQLQAVDGLIDKAGQWCGETGNGEADLLGTQLFEDMLPLAYQFKSCWTHSKLALDGIRQGSFSPDMSPLPESLDACRAKISEAIAACAAVSESELEELAGRDMAFTIPDRYHLDFTVQDFLLSFSNPNLFFHAATAYDIMRMRGVQIGKRDFMGPMRLKA